MMFETSLHSDYVDRKQLSLPFESQVLDVPFPRFQSLEFLGIKEKFADIIAPSRILFF